MGTFLSIEVFGSYKDRMSASLEVAFDEVRHIERMLSRFREDSAVHRLNASAYEHPQLVSEELFDLLDDCIEFSALSSGAFDITIARLTDLWLQCEKNGQYPSQEDISSALQNVGYQNISLDARARTISFKTPLLRLDFGAVGKGYAIDAVVEILKRQGIEKARIDFGGQLYYMDKPDSKDEYVGIRNPRKSDEEIIEYVGLKNKSISTSANYERGRHLIDPRSGRPADTGILSASMIADSAMYADMLSSAVFVLGLEKGLELLKRIKRDMKAIIITKDKTVKI